MNQSNRFEAGRFHAGRFSGNIAETDQAPYSVSISGLTINPSHGTTAEIGVHLVASAHSFPNGAPATITWQWRNDEGDIPGATEATFVPSAQDDLDNIYPVAFPSDGYPSWSGAAHTVRYAPPTLGASLDDVNLMADSGDIDIAIDGGFAGDNLNYSLASELSGLQINANTGLVTIATNGGAQSGSITVSATNSGGTATQSFAIAISDEPFIVEINGLQNGTAVVGSTLAAEVVWFVAQGEIDRIRWRSNGKVIPGERDPSYAVDPNMAGTVLSCTVTSVNNGANTSEAYPVS